MQAAELTVLDTKGSTIIFSRFFDSSELDVAGLPKGVYVVKITFGTRLVVKKLVKE